MMFLFFLGFWISFLLDGYILLIFTILYFLYLYRFYKFKSLFFLVLVGLSLCLIPSYKQASVGEYRIIEIKKNYCIAKNQDTKIVVYGLENANYGDGYWIDSFDEIHSLHNIHQFSFDTYLHQRNIYESSQIDDSHLVYKSHSIKSKLYEKYGKDPYLSLYLYGIYDESVPNILSRLSLPLITCLYALESILKLFMDKKKSAFICTCIACLFGYFFVFKTNLIRYCLYHFFHIFIEDPLECFGVSGICFLILLPTSYLDFVLIFSLGFQLISKCCSSSFKRKCASYVFIWGIQFIYFHEVDYIFLCLFSLLRKWNALLFILSFFQIHPFFTIPSLSFHYVPSILFISLFFYCMYCIFQKKKSICLLILFCLPYIETNLNPFFHVYVLDIGQGDCTLIVEPFKRSVVMIDCGQNLYRDNVESIVLPVLEDLQIHSIDYCIVTHSDFDHSGGVEELDEKFDIKHIVTSSKEDINVSYPFYSLLEDRDYDNENDMSIISYFSYDSLHYLWMGDASINVENQLLHTYDLDVDVLKLGHHGSNTSSSYSFLDNIRPKLGLVSVGYKNRYHHPHSEVIANCHNLGINILMTKDVGMIHIFTWHNYSFFETGNHLFGMLNKSQD